MYVPEDLIIQMQRRKSPTSLAGVIRESRERAIAAQSRKWIGESVRFQRLIKVKRGGAIDIDKSRNDFMRGALPMVQFLGYTYQVRPFLRRVQTLLRNIRDSERGYLPSIRCAAQCPALA